MTLQELQLLFPDATEETWHQHSNGGGWVKNTATVDDTAFVGPNALIYDNARVSGTARVSDTACVYGTARVSDTACVYGNAWVSGTARVSDNACVYGNACVSGNAWVSGTARVFDNACVYGNAMVFGDAMVYGNTKVVGVLSGGEWKTTPLFLTGTVHHISVTDQEGNVVIGGQKFHIDDWLSNYNQIGIDNAYSPEQIEEYGLILKFVKEWMVLKGIVNA